MQQKTDKKLSPHTSTTKHKSQLNWAQIPTPPKIAWNTWRKFIIRYLCNNNHQLKIEFQRKEWLLPTNKLHKIWKYFHSQIISSIYSKQYDHYIAQFSSNHKRYKLSATNKGSNKGSNTTTNLPLDATPETHIKEIEYSVHYEYAYKNKPPKIKRTWEEYTSLMGPCNKVMIKKQKAPWI